MKPLPALPPRKWFLLPGVTAFGAPIFVHWSVLAAVGAMTLLVLSNPIYPVLAIASYLAVIVVHELGHAYVAHRLGYAVETIGVAMVHGWVETRAPADEWDEALVAWGGVAAQLSIGVPVLLAAAVWGSRDWAYFGPIVVFLGYLNVVTAVVNLAPGPGTDGNTAWNIVPLLVRRWRVKRSRR